MNSAGLFVKVYMRGSPDFPVSSAGLSYFPCEKDVAGTEGDVI